MDDFVRTVLATEPQVVPDLLARSLPFIVEYAQELHSELLNYTPDFYRQALQRERPSDPATVAVYWLEACVTMDGAFWDRSARGPALTDFGKALLACVSLAGPASFDTRLTLPPETSPTEDELERLDGIIQEQMGQQHLSIAELYVLSRMLRAALPSTDIPSGRTQLAATADRLEALLLRLARREMMAEVQEDLRREAAALRQAVEGPGQARVAAAAQAVAEQRTQAIHSAVPDPELVGRLLSQARDLADQERYEEAYAPLSEALPLLRSLAGGDSTYRPKLAAALLTLAVSLQPFAVFQMLDELDGPQDLDNVLANLPTGRLEEAMAAAEEALALYRTLVRDDPAAYRPKLAFCLDMIGVVKLQLGQDEQEATDLLDEAIAVLEAAAQEDPNVAPILDQARYFRIAATQFSLVLRTLRGGMAQFGRLSEDEELVLSIESLRPLAASDPSLQPRLAEALALYGAALGGNERYDEALAPAQEASDIYLRLAAEDETYIAPFLRAYGLVCRTLYEMGRLPEALEAVREILRWYRQPIVSQLTNHQDRVSVVLALASAANTLDRAADALDRTELREEALDVLSEAVAMARGLATEDARYNEHMASVLTDVGIVLHGLGREPEVLRVFEEARERGMAPLSHVLDKPPRWDLLARLYVAHSEPTYLARAIDAAVHEAPVIQRLLAAVEELGPDVVARIEAIDSLMEELWRNGEQAEALTLEMMARFVMIRAMSSLDDWGAGARTRTLGSMEENADRLVEIARLLNDPPCEAHFLFHRAAATTLALPGTTVQALSRSTPQTIDDMRQAARIYRSLLKRDPSFRQALVTVLNNLGIVCSAQADADVVEEGVMALEEAVDLNRELAKDNPAFQEELVRGLNNLGLAYLNLSLSGARPAPEELLRDRDANRFFVKADPKLARFKAFAQFGEALNLTAELLDTQPWANSARIDLLVNMAVTAASNDEFSLALTFTDEALRRYRALSSSDSPVPAPVLETGIRLLFARGNLLQEGDAERDREQLKASYDAFAEAVTLVEAYLTDLPWHDVQLQFLGNEGMLYQQIVRTCLLLASVAEIEDERQRWQARAWQHVEGSRARLTLQTLIQAAAGTPAGASPRTQAFQQYAREIREFNAVRHNLPRDEEQGRQQALIQAWKRVRSDMDDVEALAPTELPDLKELQEELGLIPDGALLIEFYLLQDSLVLFLLDAENLRVEQAPVGPRRLASWTDSFRGSGGRPLEEALEVALSELGDHLARALAPGLAALPMPPANAPDHVPHVFFVPTADLQLWPLHALPLGDGARLIDHYAVAYLPAAAALPMLARQRTDPGPYHGFAPATDLALAPRQVQVEAAILGRGARVGAEARLGDQATFDALRTVRGGILSLATHALADMDAPERSAVLLAAPAPPAAPGADAAAMSPLEWISALEFLVELDQLHCQMLLLWGCTTHAEGEQSGDNWLGISRAFLRVGPTLVSSLWQVGDAVGLATSVEFSHGVRQGLSAPQALRRAQLAVRDAEMDKFGRWGEMVSASLPEEERKAFWRSWRRGVIEMMEGGPALAPARLGAWAPFVTIGWPSVLR